MLDTFFNGSMILWFFRDFSSSWDTLAQPLGKTGYRNNCMCWSGSTCGRRGKGRVEGTFFFSNQHYGILDTSSSRTNQQYTLHHIKLHHARSSWGLVTAGKAAQQNTGDFRKLWGQNQFIGLGGNGHTHLVCNRLLGAGLIIRPQQTENGHSSCTEVASQYREYPRAATLKPFHQKWRLPWILRP